MGPPAPPPKFSWPSIRALDLMLDAGVLAFALWSVSCHATVLTHGNGWRLFRIAGTTFGLAGVLALAHVLRARRHPLAIAEPDSPEPSPTSAKPGAAVEPVSVLGFVLALLVLCVWLVHRGGEWFWLAAIGFMLVSAALLLPRPLQGENGQVVRPRELAALLGLGLLGGLVTACMNLPNPDDVVYVNIAVSLADAPSYELYARDTIHGGGATPFAPYAVHSFELLAGLITWLTKIPALAVIHLGFGPLAGFLAPIAWARLLRRLEPARWLWLVAIVFSLYLFDGAGENSIVGYGFMRLFQGKAVLVTVLVPLLSAYAIEYARRPSGLRWLVLAAGIISGVGLSSTGLWLAPAVAGTALFVPLTWHRSWWKGVAGGFVACLYPVALGLRVRAQMVSQGMINHSGSVALGHGTIGDDWGMLLHTFGGSRATVMDGIATAAYLACLVLAWPLARTALARRYLVAFSLVGGAILLNPALKPLVAAYVTGGSTRARVLWYLPFTLAFAICFAAPIATAGSATRRLWGVLTTVVALIVFYVTVPAQSAFASAPLSFPPRLKVHRASYEVARYLADKLPSGSFVLASARVSLALPMVQHHPYPLMTKPKFFKAGSDGERRFRMRRLVDGRVTPVSGQRRARVIQILAQYDVAAVVLTNAAERVPGMKNTLHRAGFFHARKHGAFHVWLRKR